MLFAQYGSMNWYQFRQPGVTEPMAMARTYPCIMCQKLVKIHAEASSHLGQNMVSREAQADPREIPDDNSRTGMQSSN